MAESDTDMSSSSSSANSESSDSARSWGDDSSEGSGGSAQPLPPLAAAPARRVPPLALGGSLGPLSSAVSSHGEEDDSGPGTSRQAGTRLVPRLSLPSATAAAAAAAAPTSARRLPSPPRRPVAAPVHQQQQQQQVSALLQRQQQQQEPPRAASEAAQLSLDLLSPAFTVEQGQQAGSSSDSRQHLAQRCASKLGVPADRLRYYALVEVSGPQDLPSSCARAAVEVIGSSFSLSALEELVAENQRLKVAVEEVQEQGQSQPPGDRQRTGTAGAASAAEVQALQARLRDLQLESEGLRQQLRQSESLRRKGQKTLHELKHEFDGLSRALMLGHASGMVLGRQRPLPLSPPEPESRIGTPAAVSDALQQL